MNKKIIAIAIASAMAAPAAMADLKISGKMAGEFTNGGSNDEMAMSDAGQARLVFDGTAGNAFARISYKEGLAGNIGTDVRQKYLGYKFGNSNVRFGIANSALYVLEGDKWKGTYAQMKNAGMVAGNSGAERGIVQLQTKMGGATVKFDYNPNNEIDANGGALGNSGYLGVSDKGKMGNIGYFAGYGNGAGSIATSSESNMKVGASMKFGAVNTTLMYNSSDTVAGGEVSGIVLMADMGLGNGLAVNFGYSMHMDNDDTQMRLVASKSLNKGTKVYGAFSNKDLAGTATSVIGGGMIVAF